MEIFFVQLDDVGGWLAEQERSTPRLSPADNERAARIRSSEQDRQRWRTARIATRIILERWCGPDIARSEFAIADNGRPRLTVPHAPVFSISHSDAFALVAVADKGPLGVDVERPRQFRMSEARADGIIRLGEELAGRPFDNRARRDQRLLASWVRIEAVAKALDVGLSTLLNAARVFGPEPKRPLGDTRRALEELDVHDLELPGVALGCIACGHLPPGSHVLALPQSAGDLQDFLAQPVKHH